MKRLYSSGSLTEAYLVLHRLQHALPEIWIEDENDFERARAIVTEHESMRSRSDSCRCNTCGEDNPAEFEICWRCGKTTNSSRPA